VIPSGNRKGFFYACTGSVAGIVISRLFLIKFLSTPISTRSFSIFIYKKIETFQLHASNLSGF